MKVALCLIAMLALAYSAAITKQERSFLVDTFTGFSHQIQGTFSSDSHNFHNYINYYIPLIKMRHTVLRLILN